MPIHHARPPSRAGESRRTARILLLLALVAPACSDDTGGGGDRDSAVPDVVSEDVSAPDTSTSDAGADADATPPDGQDAPACTPSPVWNNDSTAFTYASGGGFSPRPLADAGCDFISTTFEFSLSASTLIERDCSYTRFLDRTIHLTAGQTARIVAALQALHTNCPMSPGCGADYPSNTLAVDTGGTVTTYYGDFYAGCPTRNHSPSIAESDFSTFVAVLVNVAYNACDADGGSSSDAGMCAPTVHDGGADGGPG